MREIDKCYICSPNNCKYDGARVNLREIFYVCELGEKALIPDNLYTCPTLRKNLRLIPENQIIIEKDENL